jgi:hypothetical protein
MRENPMVIVADCRTIVLTVVIAAARPYISEYDGMKIATKERIMETPFPMRATMKTPRRMAVPMSIMLFVLCPRPGTFSKMGRVMLVAPMIADLGMDEVKFARANKSESALHYSSLSYRVG